MRLTRALGLIAAAAASVAVPTTALGGASTGSTPHSTSSAATVAWADIEDPFGTGMFYQVVMVQPSGLTVATPGAVDLHRTWAVVAAATPGVPFNTYSCLSLANPGNGQLAPAYPASGFVDVSCNDGMGFDFYRVSWSQASWWPAYNQAVAGPSNFNGQGASLQVPLPDAFGLSFGQPGSSGTNGSLRWEHSATDVMTVQLCGHSSAGFTCRNGAGEMITTTGLTTSIVEG
jgi:hypothetical protein